MRSFFLFLSAAGAGGVRGLAGSILISSLLSVPRPGRKGIFSLLAGMAVISLLCTGGGLPDFCPILLETLLLALWAGRFQGADTRMSLFVGTFYEIGVSLWQFLSAAGLGLLLRSGSFPDLETGTGQGAVWLLHIFLAALAWYLWKHPGIGEKEGFRLVSVIVLAGFLMVVTLSQQRLLPIADDILSMWTILSVVLMMALLVFHINRQYEFEKEAARLKAEQAELLERDYVALNRAYAVNAKLFHDFHNHIGVLRRLLLLQKQEEAIRYLDELQAPVEEMTDTLWTGDETVDYLINSKAVTAREKGIRYEVEVEFPRGTNLQSADLCAILGNLLDNALDAAKQVPKSQDPFVRLVIRRINHMLVLKAENNFVHAPAEEAGVLKTSKEGNGLHGWGLKSAQTAAAKYDGLVRTSYTERIFTAVVTLSYQGISPE